MATVRRQLFLAIFLHYIANNLFFLFCCHESKYITKHASDEIVGTHER